MSQFADYDFNSMYPASIKIKVYLRSWEKIGVWAPTNWNVYSVSVKVAEWIESQSPELWRLIVAGADKWCRSEYQLSPELETWLVLKWSE